MGKKRKELSHEEIWDDSGLIESWNESYEEYKRYHSIAARGERVKDVLDAANKEQLPSVSSNRLSHNETMSDETQEDGEIEEDIQVDGENRLDAVPLTASAPNGILEVDTRISTDRKEPPEVPQSMLTNSSNDEALKSLMMSWYWAGYYTGLYEGQRSAAHPTGPPPPTRET